MHIQSLSHARLFETSWAIARQAPLSMGFSRQEYWSELPCPPPVDLPNPRIKPMSLTSPALADGFITTAVLKAAHSCDKLFKTIAGNTGSSIFFF